MFKSISKTFRSKPIAVQPTVVGTDLINQKDLVATLKTGSTSAKIAAVRQLTSSIKTVSISSIPELWFLAKQNLELSNSDQLRLETFNLFLTCIEASDHSTPTKMAYYKDILDYLASDTEYSVQSLMLLTNDGRDLYDLLIYQPYPFFKYIWSTLNNLPKREESQTQFALFLANCLKFNFNLFESKDLANLLSKVLDLATLATNIDTLTAYFQIIDTYISLGCVPPSSVRDIVGILGKAKQLGNVQLDHTIDGILVALLSSPSYSLLTFVRCTEIIGAEEKPAYGCLAFVRTYLDYYRDTSKVSTLVTDVLETASGLLVPAIASCPALTQPGVANAICSVVLSLLSLGLLSQQQLTDARFWNCLIAIDCGSVDRSTVAGLFDRLQAVASPLSREHTVRLFEKNRDVLSESQLDFVIDSYSSELRCVAITENWQQNCEALMSNFGTTDKVLAVLELAFFESLDICERREPLGHYLDFFLNDGFWSLAGYRETLAKILLRVDEQLLELLVAKFPSAAAFTQHVVYSLLVLCQSSRNTRKAGAIFDYLLKLASSAISTDHDTFLTVARLMARARPADDYIHFVDVCDVDGLCHNLARNVGTGHTRDESWKWQYPETLPYLPRELLESCSHRCLKRCDLSDWLELVVFTLETFVDWEVYSFMLGHLCPQLAYSSLFPSHDQILRLLRTLCHQLQLRFPSSFRPVAVSKTDVQVALIRTLSAIPAYRAIFSRTEEDLLISSVISALKSWDKTGIPCLHFLIVSCYEFSASIKRFLGPILSILQTRLSAAATAAPILDLLFSLSELPALISNLTTEDYKRIFAIAFKYIEYSKDSFQYKKEHDVDYLDSSLDRLPSTQSFEVSQQLLLFLTAMSYRAVCGWFLKLSMDQRSQLVDFINKNLVALGLEDTKNKVHYEAINRFVTADNSTRQIFAPDTEIEQDKDYDTCHWLHGDGLLTVASHRHTPKSLLTLRRSTAIDRFEVRLPAQHTHASLRPSFVVSALLGAQNADLKPLEMDDQVRRSVAVMDRIPVVNLHKIGVVYIGPGQTTEKDILSNQFGSDAYEAFLTRLGKLIRLRGCRDYYVGGLDTQNDQDGEYTVHHHSPVTHVCFHVTTMMPHGTDDAVSSKKRHIGNDFVNIYWNDSGEPFLFHKIASQFNFMSIVIEPCAERCYRVKIFRKAGIPAIFSTTHFKLISEHNLPSYVRNVSTLCGQFCEIWTNSDWQFNWERRYRQLQTIRARAK
ncbi:hypothetical protein KL911_004204 [Ogataea haglerorum]|uniref:uncharacterized protein n=1 Tax=Ogataea haglerorum TaxID=1937702 RepID=UPI001C8901BD|nr:uncharacterized protein KL911_004204 [Ogataea haglerorum]KAG7746588.1 hypothetical protein KL912_004165 [Ogataea haglerorum]KAG7751958.1 hypothetical protein KL911_004204 [Ogataea haglerorum]KAG7786218.1 hypothetical protein KL945_003444 [Ogataea haglerorum]KAG7786404.1 hypothetical protein KL910_004251 [Ogataea haglerorum]